MNHAKFLIKSAMEKVSARWARRALSLAQRSGDVPRWLQRHGFDMSGEGRHGFLSYLAANERGMLSRRALEDYVRAQPTNERFKRLQELRQRRMKKLHNVPEGHAFEDPKPLVPTPMRLTEIEEARTRRRRSMAMLKHERADVRESPDILQAKNPMEGARELPSGYLQAKPGYTKGYAPERTVWRGSELDELVSPKPDMFFSAHPGIAAGYGQVVMEMPRRAIGKGTFFTPHLQTTSSETRRRLLDRGVALGRSEAGKLTDYEIVGQLDPTVIRQLYVSPRGMPGENPLLPLTILNRAGKRVPYTGKEVNELFGPSIRSTREFERPVWTWPQWQKSYGA